MSLIKTVISSLKGDGSVIREVGEVIDKNFTSKRELEEKAMEIAAEQMKAQTDINKVEASHPSIFVAGWRPAIGWVGAAALAYSFILRDLFCYMLAIWSPETACPPALQMDELVWIVTSMLGIGAMRSYDKSKKVDTKRTM